MRAEATTKAKTATRTRKGGVVGAAKAAVKRFRLSSPIIKEWLRSFLTRPNLCLLGAVLILLVAGKLTSYSKYLALMLLGLSALCWDKDEFFYFVPLFLYFLTQFYPVGGTALYRLYSLLLLAKFVWKIKELSLHLPTLLAFLVILVHIVFCLWQRDSSLGFSALLDMVVVYLYISMIEGNPKLFRYFILFLGIGGLCAGAYGYFTDNFGRVAIGRSGVYSDEIARFFLTFVDPNYAGFFLTLTFFSFLCLEKPWPLWLRLPLMALTIYFFLLCNSMSSFACFAACACVYIVLKWPKQSPLILAGGVLVGLAAIWALINVEALGQISALSSIKVRVDELLVNLEGGDTEELTSGRSELWSYYWNYYQEQGLIARLFGGNVLTANYRDSALFKPVGLGTHMAYLQSLLQYGIVGASLIFGSCILWSLWKLGVYFKRDRFGPDADVWRYFLLSKVAVLLFASSVDMFPDWRFMIILLL